MLSYEVIKKDSLMRAGIIHTPHGDIKTPAFVGAATRAAVKALTMSQMKSLGSQAILANTYHLILTPGPDLIESAGGLAHFNSWHGPTFTDSGGFQIFSLPDVKVTEKGAVFKSHINGDKYEITPESSMEAQWKIGADIHMAFDHLAKSDSYEGMKAAMDRTHAWLSRSKTVHDKLKENAYIYNNEHNLAPGDAGYKPEQFLYAVVQGGDIHDLRAESAEFCKSINPDGFGIGGVFTANGMAEMLSVVNHILPEDKPRHLLGMGQEPLDLFVGAEYGCDTFDCVGPTRMARNGSLYTSEGRINIKNAKFRTDFSPVEETCPCECCKNYNRAYLHHLFKTDEILAKILASIHNEYFIVSTVDHIRASILDGSFYLYKSSFLSKYYQK